MVLDRFDNPVRQGSYITFSQLPKDLVYGRSKAEILFFESLINKPLLVSDINEASEEANLEVEFTENNQKFKWFWLSSDDVNLLK